MAKIDFEKYGITVEGSKLMIANMPADQTSITVELKLTAVGLNGSVEEAETTLTIGQAIVANGTLADKKVTLGYSKKAGYMQAVLWDIEDLGFTAVQLDQFLNADSKKLYVTYEDEDGNVINKPAENIVAFDKDGDNTTSYEDAETFGFYLDSQAYEPKEYAIRLEALEGGAAIYVAEATLTVENPELGEDYVKLVPGFVDENGVYQITGTPDYGHGAVTYTLNDALILNDEVAAIKEIIDYDNAQYIEEEREDEAFEMFPVISKPDEDTYMLKLRTWKYDWEVPAADWSEVKYNQLYKTRNIRAMIELFGNPNNVVPFDFEVVVKSEIYTETPADAITIGADKLEGVFGVKDANGNLVAIDIKSAVTKAIVQVGTDKGKTYRLFATGKGSADGVVNEVVDYSDPKTAGGYVLGTDGNIVTLSVEEYLLMSDAFTSLKDAANHDKIVSGEVTYKLKDSDWTAIWTIATNYYNKANGTGKYVDQNADGKIDNADKVDGSLIFTYSGTKTYKADDKAKMAIYDAFKTKIGFTVTTAADAGTPTTVLDKARDSRISDVTVAFDEPEVAAKYFKNVNTTTGVVFSDLATDENAGKNFGAIKITPVEEAPNGVTGGQVKVDMTLTIRDAWGMIMEVPFQVTVKTAN